MTKKQLLLRDIADIERAFDRLGEAAELAHKANILDFDGEFLDSNKCLIWDLVNVIDPSETLADYLRYRKTTPDHVADAILKWRAEQLTVDLAANLSASRAKAFPKTHNKWENDN
jgi:hypothetical protein